MLRRLSTLAILFQHRPGDNIAVAGLYKFCLKPGRVASVKTDGYQNLFTMSLKILKGVNLKQVNIKVGDTFP